ncbi:MAG: D-hexose-6-phosphate mutarotase, partial [Treponemataceae bacterium]
MSLAKYASFSIPKILEVVEGRGGLPMVKVTNQFADAEIYLHGAHVTRFDPKGEKPMIWTSPTSPFADGKSVRGGIPVCFPWFGPHKTVKDFPVHGFVRFRSCELLETAQLSDGRTRAVFGLKANDATRAFWAHDFSLEMTVTIGKSLELALSVTNTSKEAFTYEDCFHTYFAVGDTAKATVTGLDGVGFLNRGKGDARTVQSGDLTPAGETTHIYTLSPAKSAILDSVNKRKIVAEQCGLANTVVWNPWEASAAKNPEMAGMWNQFLCVEAANCIDSMITLLPGCSHTSCVSYGVEKA